jgi:serine/threonine-protein kinase
MADVWLASAEGAGGFQKNVVIKTILPRLADDPDFVRMFIEEALLAAKLSHPNVIHIFDLGESACSHFIAMEYIAGKTLREIHRQLKAEKRLPPPWFVLHVAAAACDGLDHAHTLHDEVSGHVGLVHRDVSPENIMVSFMGDTKVLDFGIAKASTSPAKTRTGVLKGKHAYMAPEQIEAAAVSSAPDPRSDIYAMGVVLYELLSGAKPFRASNDLALMRLILAGEAKPLSDFCPWIPESLSRLVAKAMSRSVDDRFQTAAALRSAIDIYLRSVNEFPSRNHVAEFMATLCPKRPTSTLPLAPAPISVGRAFPAPQLPVDEPEPIPGEPDEPSVEFMEVEDVLPDEEAVSPEPESHQATPEPASEQSSGSVWDRVTQKAREARDDGLSRRRKSLSDPTHTPAPAQSEVDPPSNDAEPSQPSGWDLVVRRARSSVIELRPATRRPRETRSAAGWFEEGLDRWKAKDMQGTLACWERAVAMDPENRRYSSNLRMLERRMAGEKGGSG